MDGYQKIQELIDKQVKINKELLETVDEINAIPEMPKNLDKWIDSIPNEKSKFKLTDYNKLFKVSKKFNKITEQQEENAQKLKIVVIEDLINKINEILGK